MVIYFGWRLILLLHLWSSTLCELNFSQEHRCILNANGFVNNMISQTKGCYLNDNKIPEYHMSFDDKENILVYKVILCPSLSLSTMSSLLKLLSQSKPNSTWNILRKGEQKLV